MITAEAPTPCQDSPWTFDAVIDHPDAYTIAAAKAICRDCPFTAQCLTLAMRSGATGVYGGHHFARPLSTWTCRGGHDLTRPGASRPKDAGGVVCIACEKAGRRSA